MKKSECYSQPYHGRYGNNKQFKEFRMTSIHIKTKNKEQLGSATFNSLSTAQYNRVAKIWHRVQVPSLQNKSTVPSTYISLLTPPLLSRASYSVLQYFYHFSSHPQILNIKKHWQYYDAICPIWYYMHDNKTIHIQLMLLVRVYNYIPGRKGEESKLCRRL